MQTLSVNEFRANLKKAADSVVSQHEPMVITRRNGGNLVLLSEEDWRATQESIHLASIPGMTESIKEGMQTPVSEMSNKLDW